MFRLYLVCLATLVSSCSNEEKWHCKIEGQTMYSVSESGQIGGAQKGCTCDQIRSFEKKSFGEVDNQALKNDFGC